MPVKTLTPCRSPGCVSLVSSGYCDRHKPNRPVNVDSNRLYGSNTWKLLRRMQLSIRPWCEECLKEGKYIPAVDVDHVVPHNGDPSLFYGGELQSLCKPCHSRKTLLEIKERYGI